jgi:hypothetical protein
MRIKHAVSIVLVMLMIFHMTSLATLFLIPKVSAQETTKMWVTPFTNIYEKGDTFSITIWLNDTADPGGPYNIKSWALEIDYDSRIIDYTGATLGSYFNGYGTTAFFPPSAHAKPVALTALLTTAGPGPEGPGDLASVHFQVKSSGRSVIDLENTELYSFDSGQIPLATPEDGVFFTTYPRASFYYLPSTTASSISGYSTPLHLSRDPFVNETVVFNATAYFLGNGFFGSYDPDTATQGNPTGAITNYVWDFDDGNVTLGDYPVITHSFSTANTYNISLTVTDNEGKYSSYASNLTPVIGDVGLSIIEVSPHVISPGETVSVKINITNYGTTSGTERVNVTLYQNNGISDTLIPYNVSRGLFAWSNVHEIDPVAKTAPLQFLKDAPPITLNYTWQTGGLPIGNYTIWADISQVSLDGTQFLKDLYLRETDLNLTNNVNVWGEVELRDIPNIAVTEIRLTPALKPPNIIDYGISQVTVQIKVENTGGYDATFNVTLYQDSTFLSEWTDVFLASKTSTVLEYTWITSALPRGYTSLVAQASNITDEVANGRTGDNKLTIRVLVTSAPLATFTSSPAKPLVGDTVQIDASASHAAPGWSISTYVWRINGTIQASYTTDTVQHRFTSRALWNVTLTVTDNAGVSSSFSQLSRVGYLPVAQFTFSPAAPKIDGAITFDASSSAPDTVAVSGDEIVSYLWDFGDGAKTAYTGANLTETTTHSYAMSGNFSVRLKVLDGEDLNATITKFVPVTKITSGVTVSMNAQSIQVGQSITISGQVTPARAGVNVSILYKTATTDWTLLQNVTSDQAGNYQYTWTINTAGNYTVKARFAGDNKYTSSESATAAIEVEATMETRPLDYTLYIIVAVIVIVTAGIAVYLIRRRK